MFWKLGLIFFYRHQRQCVQGGVLFLCVAWLVYLSLVVWMTPQVVTYRLSHTIHAFSAQVVEKHLSPEASQQLSKRFSQTLKNTLITYAKRHHVVIIKSASVVVGGEDITPEIEMLLAEAMQEENS